MIQTDHDRVTPTEVTDVGAARRRVAELAAGLGATASAAEAAEIAVTELGTNIVRHASGDGHLLVRAVDDAQFRGVEVIAADRGPGISNLAAALAGESDDRRGLGIGLSAVKRLAMTFDVHTRPSAGTVVMARFPVGDVPAGDRFAWGGVSVAAHPLDANGDGWAIVPDGDALGVVVIDGLGHGAKAHEATVAGFEVGFDGSGDGIVEWLRKANEAMRSTRGAVASVVRLDPSRRCVRFAGVGNVTGRVWTRSGSRGLMPNPGTLGVAHRVPRAHPTEVAWPPAATLVLWSDGLRSRFDLHEHPGLAERDPALIAAVLHRDYARGHDDATVVVVRERPGGEP